MIPDVPDFAALDRLIATHASELMAIPGVAGVAAGLLDDGRTPCLRLLVVARTRELEARLPRTLEGHPVVIEEAGRIRPLDGD